MVDFSTLKNNRQSNFEKLTDQLTKMSQGPQYTDDPPGMFWYPERDKTGNGYAVIRFLPAPAGEDFPWVRIWNHSFKGPGGWYIENSLTTLGKPDPVSEFNTILWDTEMEDKRNQARVQKRKLIFVSNIYIVDDPLHPENKGKVFLFRYGKKIFDKLNDKMNPPNTFEKAMNPFDLWEGANLKLKIKTVQEGSNKWPNYDSSEFDAVGPLSSDEEMERIWKMSYSLQGQISEDKFKSYDDLKSRLNKVLGLSGTGSAYSKPKSNVLDEMGETKLSEKVALAPVLPETSAKEPDKVESIIPESQENNEDDELKSFRSLMED